jgi:hypothetical protein
MVRLRRLSAAEAVTLAGLAVWALAPLVLMLRHTLPGGDVLAGSDGPFPADQLQYLSWIREAGDHLLAGNVFDLPRSDRVFLHPMFLVSGLLWKLGVGIQASYFVWKPVAVLVLFAGFALFVRRTIEGPRTRAAALVLALFNIPASAKLLDRLNVGSPEDLGRLGGLLGEAFPAGHLWGYLPTAIAVGAIPLYLLAAERGLGATSARARWLAAAGLAGVVAAWLHPWQGEVLVLVTAGLLVWGRFRRPVLPLLWPLAATALPLLYYVALSRFDGAWEVAQRQQEVGRAGVWVVLVAILPLLPLAALGAPRRPQDVCERSLLLLPVAMFATYWVFSPSVPSHALEGISLPLAVMSVRGWQALRLPAAAGALVVTALILPGAYLAADALRDAVEAHTQPHYLSADEARALDELERDPRPGGVVADPRLAAAVPVYSGRPVWAGHPSWTRDFNLRVAGVDGLFGGRLRGPVADQLLRKSGARFALQGCGRRVDLRATAAGAVARARRVGCATIYDLRGGRVP